MEEGIKLSNITKTFGKAVALDNVNLNIAPGSFTSLLGPSGCGKTTLLRILAGLEDADSGLIEVGGRTFFDKDNDIYIPARKREIGLVFQSYALWPHLTVFENVSYGLRISKVSKEEIARRVDKVLEKVEMTGYEGRYPNELSGGQQQRISMARVLVTEPSVLLMDEPLSNLDAKLRLSMRAELKRFHREMGLTIVYVTHDQSEAMTLSTNIAVMKSGVVQQYDNPETVYNRPGNLFVADFMGDPQVNLMDGLILKQNEETTVKIFDETELDISDDLEGTVEDGQEVSVAIHPENIKISQEEKPGYMKFKVIAVLDSGAYRYIYISKGESSIVVHDVFKVSSKNDEYLYIEFPPEHINMYDKESENIISKNNLSGDK